MCVGDFRFELSQGSRCQFGDVLDSRRFDHLIRGVQRQFAWTSTAVSAAVSAVVAVRVLHVQRWQQQLRAGDICATVYSNGRMKITSDQWRRNEFQSEGRMSVAKRGKNFLGSTSTISRLGGQYRLISFLFAVLLPTVSICKSGKGARAPVPYGAGASANDRM